MTQEDHPSRQRRPQTFRWVAIVGGTFAGVFALVDGQLLLTSMWAAFLSGMLVEATGLDERSSVAKRIGQALTVIFAALSVFYFYTVVVS